MSLAPWGNLVCDLYINDLEFSSPCQDAIMILEQQKWGGTDFGSTSHPGDAN